MLGYLSHNPEYDLQYEEERRAEANWQYAQTIAEDLAERYVTEADGDVLVALWRFVIGKAWRMAPDTLELLVHDATTLNLQERLTTAQLMAWQQIAEESPTFVLMCVATAARHIRAMHPHPMRHAA